MHNPMIIKETNTGNQYYTVNDFLFNQRKLFLTDEVTSSVCTELIRQLMYLDSFDTDKEITIYIDSPGGCVLNGLCLYDAIMNCKSKVTTFCIGQAASMAAVLFLAGSKRIMLPDSKLMYHDPSTFFGDSVTKVMDVKDRLEDLMNVRTRLAEIISDRSGNDIKTVYKLTAKDTYLTSEEALKMGFASEISTSKGENNYDD